MAETRFASDARTDGLKDGAILSPTSFIFITFREKTVRSKYIRKRTIFFHESNHMECYKGANILTKYFVIPSKCLHCPFITVFGAPSSFSENCMKNLKTGPGLQMSYM